MASKVVDKLDRFFAAYPLRTYPKGQILVFANEAPSHIFYVVSGRVRKYDITYRGYEVIVNVFKHPAFFPMAWALNRTKNKYFYAAETVVQVRVAPPDDVVRFLQSNVDVLMVLVARLYQNNEGLLGRVVQLMSGSARTRLIYELVIEARRFGELLSTGEYRLDLSEADLAARSGMSRETVSREFSKLAREGLVRGTRQGMIVNDLGGLVAKIGRDDV
jgi:CRP-like cAMP-binding protein